MAFCIKCGTQINDNTPFCTACGSPQSKPVTPPARQPDVEASPPVIPAPAPSPTPTPVAPAPAFVSPPAYQVPAAQNLPAPQKPVKIYSDAPISVIGYIGTLILYAIPLVGIIMCIVWAASSKNRNRKNLSIAVLILTIIGIILSVVLYFVAASFINGILDSYYGATGLYDLLY